MSNSADLSERKAIAAWRDLPRTRFETLDVKPLTPTLGAEVTGVDFSALTDAQFSEIRQALLENAVLIFRDAPFDRETHKAFARRFGRLHRHVLAGAAAADGIAHDPEILAWRTDATSSYVVGGDWHHDVTCDESPLWLSLLRLPGQPPGGGGDTAFANMVLAYETLSDSLKTYLEGLTAIHDGAKPWTAAYGIALPAGKTFPKAEHPLIVRHPYTGRKLLFVNTGFTTRIPQLTRRESDALLNLLFEHVAHGLTFQARFRWEPDSLLVWDNWATQHHAVWDYFPEPRHGERVSVLIETPPRR
jgi:taurine dioxygenase